MTGLLDYLRTKRKYTSLTETEEEVYEALYSHILSELDDWKLVAPD